MASRKATTAARTAQNTAKAKPTTAQLRRAADILAKRRGPDTEHPVSEYRRLEKAAPPRKRGSKVLKGRGQRSGIERSA